MSRVIIRYSNIYDMNLSKWLHGMWDDELVFANILYANRIQEFWNQYEDKVFNFFKKEGLFMPREIIAYPVSPWSRMTNFSDPFTFVRNDNLMQVFSVFAHELSHITFSQAQNKKMKVKVYQNIQQNFPKESYATRIHIAINFMQKSLMEVILPEAQKVLDKEKRVNDNLYPGQKRAWKILDQKLSKLDVLRPTDSLLGM